MIDAREVDFTLGLDRWGDVQIVARVIPPRSAPFVASERARLDPGDVGAVELLHIRAFDEHDQAHEVLAKLTPEEIIRVIDAACHEADAQKENEEGETDEAAHR